tara:strand:- start:202 stop:903 length:702 start_codon:yes stop_codon:yes gene_type:complete
LNNVFLITPFPEMVKAVVSESIIGRSEKKDLVKFHILNLFDYADSPHFRIDDYPFGGGPGMVLKPEPIFRALDDIKEKLKGADNLRVIFPTPDGNAFNQNKASELSHDENLVFISGHYKGIDQRIRDELVTDEISIGDFILTGGELPSLMILDAVIRLIPGVINTYESAQTDSFSSELLDCPYYTRPEEYRGFSTPSVLLSGNHGDIEKWKQEEREKKTKDRRPDIWAKNKKI